MQLLTNNFPGSRSSFYNPVLWLVFLLYLMMATFTIAHHEMWGDEIHSWNIAKASGSYVSLIHNIRYEGHPPVWYTILWTIANFTHDIGYVQVVHITIACLSVFLLLFFSSIPVSLRVIIPFGYFFLFEYAALSRNYAVGVLLALCLCVILRRQFRYKQVLYYLLLFLLTNTHLLAMLLAASIHLYFLLLQYEAKQKRSLVYAHALAGILVALPSCYFMFPPSDSQLNTQFWVDRWNYHNLTAFVQAPLRSFLPMPAWWNSSFWHTEFLIELKDSHVVFKILNVLMALLMAGIAFSVLRTNRKSLLLFSANFGLSFLVAVLVFPMTSARYAGFIYIGFIVAFWFFCSETIINKRNYRLLLAVLLIQLCGGIFASLKDMRRPFSNAYTVKELVGKVPKGEKVVTDYWAMNAVAAFIDKKMYCIDLGKEISFVQWNSELGEMAKNPYRYTDGVRKLFDQERIQQVYMVTIGSPQALQAVDARLFKQYRLELVEKREGAIEKGGNLYLYRISRITNEGLAIFQPKTE